MSNSHESAPGAAGTTARGESDGAASVDGDGLRR